MSILKPSVSKMFLTIFLFIYPLIIGYLQIIPPIERAHTTLVYPFTMLANFLLGIFPNNLLLEFLTWIIGDVVIFYFISCLIVSCIGLLKQE